MKDQMVEMPAKFADAEYTADGQKRARVPLSHPETLWFNTGTLCNIACTNCYIESSPSNDALVYLTPSDVSSYLSQIEQRSWPVREIGFTGGEPFMNPDIIELIRLSLAAGYRVLVLTNAMRPMMRPAMQRGLESLNAKYPGQLTMRVSIDHWRREENDNVRGSGNFLSALEGMDWLRDRGFDLNVAARVLWNETEAEARASFGALFADRGYDIDPTHPGELVLFPEMDGSKDVPEITTACWSILNKSPASVMCASSRMVVRRKGAEHPSVIACTLLPYEPEFELGTTLKEAEKDVALNHPHCAKFCVLGGASCSV